MRLKGKKAFITAAAQGIGRAISETFIAEGGDVVAVNGKIAMMPIQLGTADKE